MSNEFKLVPVEPDEGMMRAALAAMSAQSGNIFQVLKEAIAASPQPPALGGEPEIVGYRINADAPAISGYTLTLNPVAEGKYQIPVTDLFHFAPLQAEISDYKAGQERYETLCEDQRTEIGQLKARNAEMEASLRELESGSGSSPGANKKWAKVRAALSKPAGSQSNVD